MRNGNLLQSREISAKRIRVNQGLGVMPSWQKLGIILGNKMSENLSYVNSKIYSTKLRYIVKWRSILNRFRWLFLWKIVSESPILRTWHYVYSQKTFYFLWVCLILTSQSRNLITRLTLVLSPHNNEIQQLCLLTWWPYFLKNACHCKIQQYNCFNYKNYSW